MESKLSKETTSKKSMRSQILLRSRP